MALAVAGDQPETRIVEAIPAVLAWNYWSHTILRSYCKLTDVRAGVRLAWLADLVVTVHRDQGFPGGCLRPRELELFAKHWTDRLPDKPDDLGRPSLEKNLPPLWKRWKINYASPLAAFIERARRLHEMRSMHPSQVP
jgi:hypothetical protein